MPVGGAEDFALAVAHYLPEPYRARFICLRTLGPLGEEARERGFPVDLLPLMPGHRVRWGANRQLMNWCREQNIQVVHSQTYHAHAHTCQLPGGPKIVLHQQKTLSREKWHREALLRRKFRKADGVVALSEAMAEEMQTHYNLSSLPVTIPNVVDPAEFTRANPERRLNLRQELGLPVDKFLIGQIGSLRNVKNHDLTLSWVDSWDHPDVHWVFLGEGPESSRLRTKPRPQVTWAGAQRPVGPWVQALDAVVHPSLWEGQPLSLLQARACCLPIVASNISGNRAALGDDYPGLFSLEKPNDGLAQLHALQAEPTQRAAWSMWNEAPPLPMADQVAQHLASFYDTLLDPEKP